MAHHCAKANVCLILEGTYPYVPGGVSTWTHELIQMQDHLTFSIIALLRSGADTRMVFDLPKNVVSVTPVFLQELPLGTGRLPRGKEEQLFAALEAPLQKLQKQASLKELKAIIRALHDAHAKLGSRTLMDSNAAWEMLIRMYQNSMPDSSFLDYFWSWRALFGGLYSILLAEMPEADLYHALCTGYAGLFLARAHLETGRPCLVTEHGIYTNERRIEIASAEWLHDQKSYHLGIQRTPENTELRDFWIDTFCGYSRLCYEAASRIVTLYEGNQTVQLMDGAEKKKTMVIPNGIDFERFSSITPDDKNRPPSIALIGRIVPIKDIKTFIRAVAILAESVPEIRAYVMGPVDEDKEYYQECLEVVQHLGLKKAIQFTGKVKLHDYLGKIDVVALTSLSEAQPLVILEVGAAGIPTVATNVGSCSEIILGKDDSLGAGGIITPLANPQATADALIKLLNDKREYKKCSTAIRERVKRYYNKAEQHKAYAELYQGFLKSRSRKRVA
jgi:glycosyltransferase involved in cell wall biosynthesis